MNDSLLVYIVVGAAQVLSILGGGFLLAYKVGRSTQKLEGAIEVQSVLQRSNHDEIKSIKADLGALNALLAEVAVQKAAIERLEKWYDEMRHGEGFVYPLKRPVTG